MFATDFDRKNDVTSAPRSVTPYTRNERNQHQQNPVWQSLAVRREGLQSASAKLASLGYAPPAAAGGQAAALPPQGAALPGPGVGGQVPAPLPLGPIAQAKSNAIAAVDHTMERLRHAIASRDTLGIVPHDVEEALSCFFPGFGDDFLEDILARIAPMSGWIPGVRVVDVPHHQGAVPAGFNDAALLNHPNVSPYAHTFVRRVLGGLMQPGPDYVAVFLDWHNDQKLQATRLLHECFHYLFVGMFHDKPLNNAFGWQGFVSHVGGLEIAEKVFNQYNCARQLPRRIL